MKKISMTILASGLIFAVSANFPLDSIAADGETRIYVSPNPEAKGFLKAPNLRWQQIAEHYLPSIGIEDWQKLYSQGNFQKGKSAFEVASSWERSKPHLPQEISALFDSQPELLIATPEHETPLKGIGKGSQSDVLAFVRINGDTCAMTVEGKVEESFNETIDSWLKRASSERSKENRETRLEYLSEVLGIQYPPDGKIHYQLLHRTAAAVIEGSQSRFNVDCAVMLVQSFSPEHKRFGDFENFLELFAIHSAQPGKLYEIKKSGIPLWVGWVTSTKEPPAPVETVAVADGKNEPANTPEIDLDSPRTELFDMNYVWVLLLMVVVVVAVIVVSKFQKTKINEDPGKINEDPGKNFEKYVGKLLDRPSKKLDLLQPTNKFSYPDFTAVISDENGKEHTISIECKFKGDFYDGKYPIIKELQLRKYKDYQKKKSCPFFIILGVGGNSSNPTYLYSIPLEKISNLKCTFDHLRPYQQIHTGESKYSPSQNTLEISR